MKVNIRDIKVEKSDTNTKRVRINFGDILKLAESIKNNGLLHPVVVDELEGDSEKKYRLIAGERRIRACIFNGMTKIPATLFSKLDDIDRKICELEENTIRADLAWQEQAEALRQLDELKRKKFGSSYKGSSSKEGEKKWGLKDTAEAVGMSKGSVSMDIQLATTLRERPDLAKKVAKLPKHAARKIVRQTLEEESLQRQIDKHDISIDSSLRLGPCEELIKELDDESIDLLLTDPPFGSDKVVGVSSANAPSGAMPTYNLTETNVSTDKEMAKVYQKLIPEVFRVLKPGAHIYVFFGFDWYCRLVTLLRHVGFEVDSQPLIWHKKRVSVMSKDLHYMSSYEAVLFGYKPPRDRILTKPVPNVISISALSHQYKTHPLQRPHELLKLFIENSSSIGQTILDPFAGSASTLVSARRLQRSCITFEIDKGNYLRAQSWLGKEKKNEV